MTRSTSMPNESNQAGGAAQEAGRGLSLLVREDLGVGEPRRVVHRDVDELPTELAT